MPTGVWNRTEAYRIKMRDVMNRPETKKKTRLARAKQIFSAETQKKKSLTMKSKGIRPPVYFGESHPRWAGGIERIRAICRRRRMLRKKVGGSHTLGDWLNLKAQYNWTCPACGKKEPEIKLTEDHIIPLTKGGSDNIENIQPLCYSCNCRKGNRHSTKYYLMGVGG